MFTNIGIVWMLGTYIAFGPNVPQQMILYTDIPQLSFPTFEACALAEKAIYESGQVKWPVVLACRPADKL